MHETFRTGNGKQLSVFLGDYAEAGFSFDESPTIVQWRFLPHKDFSRDYPIWLSGLQSSVSAIDNIRRPLQSQ